jgi:hypothetical protein
MSKKIVIGLTCLILASLAATAGSGIFSFIRAVPQGNDILLQWKSGNEAGIIRYEVERKSEEVTEFRRVSGGITARGNNTTYTFTDDGAFFKPQGGKKFTYRVKGVGTNFEQYSSFTTVVHEVSSVRRSWGMIKELFR